MMEFPQHSQQLLSALRSQRQRGFLCDCTVMVGSAHFLAHRAVLASCSPFFHMFYSDSPGGNGAGNSVTLDSDIVTPAAFGLLLDFVYEGVLPLEDSPPVEDILAAASFLHMNEVVRECKRRLHRRGPSAEADSTRSDENATLKKATETGKESATDTGGELSVVIAANHFIPLTAAAPHLTVAERSPMESVKSEQRSERSLKVADTTQPGMDGSPQPLGKELAHARLENVVRSEGSAICSPCSTTETCSQSSNQQPSSSSSSSLPVRSQRGSQSVTTNTTHTTPQRAAPQIRIQSAVSLKSRCFSSAYTSPTLPTAETVAGASLASRNEGSRLPIVEVRPHSIDETTDIKVEAIVISDDEQGEDNEEGGDTSPLMEEGEEFEEDIQDENMDGSHFLSANSAVSDYTFPLSPSSHSPGAGSSSQDASSFSVPLVTLSTSQQQSDQANYFQSFQDSLGNFIEDVPTCGVCGKTFSCSYTLRRHAIVHTRERPYECRYCYRSYTQSGDLYRHIRKTHDKTLPAKRRKVDVESDLLEETPAAQAASVQPPSTQAPQQPPPPPHS